MTNHDRRSDPKDGELQRLVAVYIDRLIAGEEIEPIEIIAHHPEFGERILEELETFTHIGGAADTTPLGTIGDYTLRRQIGRGGMGVVYDAWENSLDRRVALKVLPPGVAADPKSSTRFLREAQIAAKLSHPQIVPVHATGIKDNTPWYAMEFIEGETLAQVIGKIKDAEPETETPFGPKDQVDYFAKIARAVADVADGLQHAHSKGVIHRDIKPSNLILDEKRRLRILDFGLARLEGQESITISGDVVGTPLYMSPEQARQKKIEIDHRTDVYSLGATMYEMIVGRPPFKGKNHQDTLSQIIERDPIDPRKVNQRVPKELDTVVLKCLRKDPADRYGTAEALGQDLRRFVRGDPVEARPQGRWEKVRGRIVRHRRVIAVRSLIALLIIACLSLVYHALRPEQPHDKFDTVALLENVNSDYMETSPTISSDGRELYFGSLRPDGEGSYDIWVAWRPEPQEPWGKPQNVADLNTTGHEEPAWLSPDGLKLYCISVKGKNEDIFYATRDERSPDSEWKRSPDSLAELREINTVKQEDMPSLTPDELEMFFSSNRDGGVGGRDIWVATRPDPQSPWGKPRNVKEINTEALESWPCISSDGLTLWWSLRWTGVILTATRSTRHDSFGKVQVLAGPVNSKDYEGQIEVSRKWPAHGSVAYFVRGPNSMKLDLYCAQWITSLGARATQRAKK